jgi:hypothetical protein
MGLLTRGIGRVDSISMDVSGISILLKDRELLQLILASYIASSTCFGGSRSPVRYL